MLSHGTTDSLAHAGYGGSHGRAMNTSDDNARELMVRWVQFGAFCPLFRIHGFRAPNMSAAHTCVRRLSATFPFPFLREAHASIRTHIRFAYRSHSNRPYETN